jgi:hypothetical protein
MAGYLCGGCDGAEPAAILITPLNGAETLAIGENCMPVTWTGILAGVIDVPAEALWDACVALKQAIIDHQADTDGQAAEAAEGVPGTEDASTSGEGITVAGVGDTPPRPPRSTRRPAAAKPGRTR